MYKSCTSLLVLVDIIFLNAKNIVGNALMFDHYTFRPSCGPGGIDDISEVSGKKFSFNFGGMLCVDMVLLSIDVEHHQVAGFLRKQYVSCGNNYVCSSILEDVSDTVLRIAGSMC